jgi:CBS domain-containing protein
MKCSEVMTKDPVCCLSTDTVDKAAQLMRDENVGPIPVVADQQTKKLIGIITDRDLALKVVAEARDAKSTRVDDVMTTGIVACREGDDFENALKAMEEHQVRRIPVIDENDHIVGIIAQADIATRVGKAKKTAEMVEEISKPTTAGQ